MLTWWAGLVCAGLGVAACVPASPPPGANTAAVTSQTAGGPVSVPARDLPAAQPTTGVSSTATSAPPTPVSAPPAGTATGAGQGFSPQPVSVGRLLLTTLRGDASGVAMRVWVWLPPQYDQPAYATTRFPVLVLFPGGDGVSYTQWFSPEKVGMLAAGAAAGQLSPFVVVEPQLQLSTQLDTECTDLAGLPRVGTFMETDVPAMVKANFRVAPSRSGWGVGGVSSGAYCASRLLFARPDVYSVGASLGGYFVIQTPLPAGRTAAARATSPQVIAAQAPPAVRLRLWAGTADPVALHENQAFLTAVRAPTVADLQVTQQGTHTWTTFQRQLPEMFAYFTANLDKPTAEG